MIIVDIYIKLKEKILDPQGLTVKHALESLGYGEVKEVRTGKLISIKIDGNDRKEVQDRVKEMCKKLLVNPIIEDYNFQIREEGIG